MFLFFVIKLNLRDSFIQWIVPMVTIEIMIGKDNIRNEWISTNFWRCFSIFLYENDATSMVAALNTQGILSVAVYATSNFQAYQYI